MNGRNQTRDSWEQLLLVAGASVTNAINFS